MLFKKLTKRDLVRKFIHAAGILAIPYDIYVGHKFVVYSFFGLIFVYLFSELLRKRKVKVPITGDLIAYCAYPSEKKSFVYPPLLYLISLFFIYAFFSKTSAYIATIAMTIGDAAALIIGKEFGKRKLFYNKNKTFEGTFAFFFTTYLVIVFFIDPIRAFVIALVAALLESLTQHIDNLTVPLGAALLVEFLK